MDVTDAAADSSKLVFLFDFISHNAWLAYGRTRQIAERHGLAFEPVPVVFGALLKASGGLGPAEIPGKGRWMMRDVVRKSIRHGIPLNPPRGHPFNPLPALRLACCASLDRDARVTLIDTLFPAVWADARDPADAADLLAGSAFDAPALIAESQLDATKERLRRNTDQALAAGVFGVPTVLARGQLFWGFDDLPNLEDVLAGNDPLDGVDLAPWFAVKPAVQRKR